jgi:hypothetical protein
MTIADKIIVVLSAMLAAPVIAVLSGLVFDAAPIASVIQ